jgi:hypothetical protein
MGWDGGRGSKERKQLCGMRALLRGHEAGIFYSFLSYYPFFFMRLSLSLSLYNDCRDTREKNVTSTANSQDFVSLVARCTWKMNAFFFIDCIYCTAQTEICKGYGIYVTQMCSATIVRRTQETIGAMQIHHHLSNTTQPNEGNKIRPSSTSSRHPIPMSSKSFH